MSEDKLAFLKYWCMPVKFWSLSVVAVWKTLQLWDKGEHKRIRTSFRSVNYQDFWLRRKIQKSLESVIKPGVRSASISWCKSVSVSNSSWWIQIVKSNPNSDPNLDSYAEVNLYQCLDEFNYYIQDFKYKMEAESRLHCSLTVTRMIQDPDSFCIQTIQIDFTQDWNSSWPDWKASRFW